MKLKALFLVLMSWMVFSGCQLAAQQEGSVAEVLTRKPKIETTGFKTTLPIEILGTKTIVQAKVNGKSFRFLLDTGSPSIISKQVADEIGLEVMGTNTGQDANGNRVDMNVSVLENLEMGNVGFTNVPVFIFDFSRLPAGREFFDGGVIGSEIMPLCTWQINFNDSELILTDDVSRLDHVKDVDSAKLKTFGYPYAPIFEYEINGRFKDNAMFDTGSTELLHLNKYAFEELKKRKLVGEGIAEAIGTFGEGAGGRGEDTTFHRVPLSRLQVGSVRFDDLSVWTRNLVPTLVGARLFETHIVTLDYANGVAYFDRYQQLEERSSFGFSTYIKDGSVFVGFLERGSVADRAGIKLHDQILAVGDQEFEAIESAEEFKTLKELGRIHRQDAVQLTLRHDGAVRNVKLQKE